MVLKNDFIVLNCLVGCIWPTTAILVKTYLLLQSALNTFSAAGWRVVSGEARLGRGLPLLLPLLLLLLLLLLLPLLLLFPIPPTPSPMICSHGEGRWGWMEARCIFTGGAALWHLFSNAYLPWIFVIVLVIPFFISQDMSPKGGISVYLSMFKT